MTVGTNRAVGVMNATLASEIITLSYIATLVTDVIMTAPLPMVVTDITGRVRVAGTGGACTLSFYKVPNGIAIANGTLLHTGTYNMVGSADANQTLTLVANNTGTPPPLNLAAGDSIGYVLTGTATSAVGIVNVTLEYL